MMSRASLLNRFLHQNVLHCGIEIAGDDNQIDRRHERHELRNENASAFDVIVDAHCAISCVFADGTVDHKLWQSKKIVPNHHPLPQDASRGCNTSGALRCKAKGTVPDAYFSASCQNIPGTDLRFVNAGINEPRAHDQNSTRDQSAAAFLGSLPQQPRHRRDNNQNRSACQHSLSNSVQVISGGQL